MDGVRGFYVHDDDDVDNGIVKEYLFVLDENEGIEKAHDIRDWPGYRSEKDPDTNIRAAIFYGDIIDGKNPRVTWEEV